MWVFKSKKAARLSDHLHVLLHSKPACDLNIKKKGEDIKGSGHLNFEVIQDGKTTFIGWDPKGFEK